MGNGAVKKTVPKWRNAYIARAHGDILNLSYAYVYCVYESRLRVRLLRVGIQLRGLFIGRVLRQFSSSCCAF